MPTTKDTDHLRSSAGRFNELDSMRGIAALIVLFSHFVNMFYPAVRSTTGWRSELLYPLIAGHESVMFFFVLSGFVLALPFLRGKSHPYPIFLWRRVLRIYGPYLGALILAIAGCAIWHNRLGSTGWAAGTWGRQVDIRSVIEHIAFLGNYDYSRYDTAFWSLVYEMRISIIFPVLFFVTDRLRLRYTAILAAACILIGVCASNSKSLITLEYAAIFMVGILLAKNLASLSELYRRSTVWERWLLVAFAFLFYNGGHLLTGLGPLWHLGDMPVVAGAVGFMLVGLNSSRARSILNSTVPAFLGKISYSFYLVHGTVLFAMAAMLKDKIRPLDFLVLYIPVAILLSWGFYRAVEAPFTRLSRNAARRLVAVPVLAGKG